MPDFAGEARGPDLDPTVEHDATPDAGTQGDHHDVAVAAGGAQAVLGQHREVGVVLDHDPASRQPVADELGPVDPVGLGQVGREAQAAVPVQHARRAHADGHVTGGGELPIEVVDDLRHRVADMAADNARAAGRRGDTRLRDDVVGGAEGDAEDLGAADVDAVGHVGGRTAAPVRSHEMDSTRAFSSRMAVAMMRLVARILMKPGMGTRRVASTWYVTSVPPSPLGSKT